MLMVGIFEIVNLANYNFFNPYSVPNMITAIVLTFLAVLVIYKNSRKMINWSFGLVIASIAWWQLWNSLAYNTPNAELSNTLFTIGFLGVNFIAPHLFHYVVLLTEKKFTKLAYLNYVVAVVFSVILFTTDLIIEGVYTTFWGFYTKSGALMIYQSMWLSGFVLLSLFMVSHYYLTNKNELNRIKANQIKYFIVGFFVAIFTLVDYLPNYGIEIYPPGFLFLTVFAFFLSYTIIRFRFMDIETAFHKTIALSVSSISIFLLIAGLAIILFQWVKLLNTLTIALFGLFLMYLGSWYHGRIQPHINRVFLKKSFEYQKKASDMIEELSAIYKKGVFAETLLQGVYKLFYPKRIFLMIRRGEGFGDFEFYERGKSPQIQRVVKIKSSHPLCDMLHKGSSVIDAGELEFESTAESKRALKWIRKNRIDILVCLKNAGDVIGFIGLGKKESLKYYNSEEINLLERLSSRLGNELNDTLIQEKLVDKEKRVREEVEKEVKKRTKDLEDTKMALINIMEDVEETNIKLSKAQKELKSSYSALKELDVKKDEFISIAAHELKTPLTAIHGFSQLLKKDKVIKDTALSKKYLGIIDTETNRLAHMVTEILELSKIDLGTIRFEVENINIRDVMDSIMNGMAVRAAERGLKLECNIEKGVEYIESDRERFIQIIMNLVDNAIKYTPKGKISVNIKAEKDNVHCCVKDTGIGIPTKHKENIFQRFYQVDSSYTRKGSGTGLGLSIVKEYLDKLGGRFWVESRFGKGSEFHFTLPLKAPGKLKKKTGNGNY
jgi:signal transduction histidine kinase